MQTAGNGIALARQLTGHSRAELARSAGISEQTLLRVEMGAIEATPAFVTRVSRALGVNIMAMTTPEDAATAALLSPHDAESA